jgi:hypothetical protein
MRVLLLHSDDDFPASGPSRRWDLVVDLGRAPKFFYERASVALRCPVFSIFDLAVEVGDLQDWRALLKQGLGLVVDRYGIDWWDVISLMLQPEMQDVRLAVRLAESLKGCRELSVSRPSVIAEAVRMHLGIPLRVLQSRTGATLHNLRRRGRVLTNLSFVQLRQVVYDKYDPHYRWRKKLVGSPGRLSGSDPVVLLPTAYSNVTKTALGYARILPEQKFFLVVARESAAVDSLPENVETARLASFATRGCDRTQLDQLEDNWKSLEQQLKEFPEFKLSVQLGILGKGPRWLRWGVTVRDAWRQVFETRSVISCLSADDSNPYTRIPLLLAEQRGIPAVACHHGALDCRMALKNLRFSSYLAKGDMERDYLERVCAVDVERMKIGAPQSAQSQGVAWSDDAPWITFFSEPYETEFWRAEMIYREILPRLCAAARRSGKIVALKLHPFESARQRRKMVAGILSEDDRKLVSVTDAPMSREVLSKTWCAVTVESTAAFECAAVGIPAFLCGWLRQSYSGYIPQYVRFGVGRMLESADQLSQIPEMMRADTSIPGTIRQQAKPILPNELSAILCGGPLTDKVSRESFR